MKKLRSVATNFWSDPYIEELHSDFKLVYLYLITNDKTNMLGVYEASSKKIAFEVSLTANRVEEGLDVFKKDKKIYYENNYVVLFNFLKHQRFNTNMKKSAIDVYNSLPTEYRFGDLDLSKDNVDEDFDILSNHYLTLSKGEVESKAKPEKIKKNIKTKEKKESKLETSKTRRIFEFDRTRNCLYLLNYSEEDLYCYHYLIICDKGTILGELHKYLDIKISPEHLEKFASNVLKELTKNEITSDLAVDYIEFARLSDLLFKQIIEHYIDPSSSKTISYKNNNR
jgi:hypothetical protein